VRARGLTAAIDTAAGGTSAGWDVVLPRVDLVLLCVKSSIASKHARITGSADDRPFRQMLSFLAATRARGIDTWIRFVLMSPPERWAPEDEDLGAFYLTLVPIRPRSRGERRSLRTFPGVSLRPGSLAFNPRPRRLSTPLLTPFNSTPKSSLVWNGP
jgi:hypothetical protein